MATEIISLFGKLFTSFTAYDILVIGGTIIAALVVLLSCLKKVKEIDRYLEEWKRNRNPDFSDFQHEKLATRYNMFLALISIFPLLGMLGTVLGLLNVDFTTGNLDGVKANFFTALTSTAWGIVASVGYKIANAAYANKIETAIDESKKLAKQPEFVHPKKSR